MTSNRAILALFLIPILLNACSMRETRPVAAAIGECLVERVDAAIENTTAARLMTADNMLYPAECHRQALQSVLARRDPATGMPRPFLLFIHGLGQHPARAYREALLTSLEQQHGVAAVMMTWPSWNGYGKLADDNARESGDELLAILEILAELKASQAIDRPFTLLTHSSGSLVVEELVRRYPDRQPQRLFDALVLSSSVSAIDTHRQWFDRQTLAARIYSVSNHEDFALRCLESDLQAFGICDQNFDSVLGRLDADSVEPGILSTNAIYLDLSDALKSKHRYYIYGNDFDPAKRVSGLFRDLLRGESPDFTELTQVIPGRLYRYRAKGFRDDRPVLTLSYGRRPSPGDA
jgi:pimeloyl-ACP methyl ester carboxylesterase